MQTLKGSNKKKNTESNYYICGKEMSKQDIQGLIIQLYNKQVSENATEDFFSPRQGFSV